MARKQSDYLDALLTPADDESETRARAPRTRGAALLGRETALARINSGEVRQVTELRIDPARARVWPGNARRYAALTEANCRELIDSLIAEGGQKLPAVVRRLDNDPAYDYEVIAGTRRHFAVSWLRRNTYPDMTFLAHVETLDDEAAFRLADLENRARRDVSDFERARNYLAALETHYAGQLTRMAERLRVSKGWLSKSLAVARLPDNVIAAFADPCELRIKPLYALAQAYAAGTTKARRIERAATGLVAVQEERRSAGRAPLPTSQVLRDLLQAVEKRSAATLPRVRARDGRPALSTLSVGRQGATFRVHPGSGLTTEEMLDALRETLTQLELQGHRLTE